MRYYVIGADGNRYGPVDMTQLQAWVGEGRVTRTTMVVEEMSGQQYAASAIAGLNFPMTGPEVNAPAGSGYYHRPGYGAPQGGAYDPRPAPNTGLTIGLAAFSMICCCLIGGIVSLIYAIQANSQASAGNISEAYRLDGTARNWAYASIAIGAVISILYFVAGMAGGFR